MNEKMTFQNGHVQKKKNLKKQMVVKSRDMDK